MKNTKNNKGITLVALIITIVVLLILAMVAIGAVEESNIIAHAQNAATSYNQKRTEEEDILTDAEGLLGNLVNSINTGNKTPIPPTPPATTEVRYYKSPDLIQELKITGNNVIANVYTIDGDIINFMRGPIAAVINNVVTPVTINVFGAGSEEITTSDEQIEISETISGYIKGNYLYGANGDEPGVYGAYHLITDNEEIADIEQKIANLNS